MKAQRPLLAKRYAIHLPLDLGELTPHFVGTDVATGQTVVAAFAGSEQMRIWGAGVGASHRHLAAAIEAVTSPNFEAFPSLGEQLPAGPVIVAELIRGCRLADLLRREPMNSERAVAWTIRILEGVQVLHQRRVPHGALSSQAIVAEPNGRPICPVVSQLIVPPLKDYASPERLTGSGPTIADDLWAIGLLLFEMLAGKLPFSSQASTWGRCELLDADSQRLRAMPFGRELEGIVKRALSADQSRRPSSADEAIEWLDHWERRVALPAAAVRMPAPKREASTSKAGQPAAWDRLHADFEGGGARLEATLDAAEQMRHSLMTDPSASSRSSRPSQGATRRRMPSMGHELAAFRERSKPKWRGRAIAAGLLMGLIAVGYHYASQRREGENFASAPSVSASFEPVVAASGLAPPRQHLSASAERSLCIRSYYRPDTFAEGMDLGFVCTEEDFLAVNRRLNEETYVSQVAASGTAGAPTTLPAPAAVASSASAASSAMVIRSGVAAKGWQLGWYELVATAIIRQNCCREAAPIKLPESTGWCQQLQTVVRRIAADSVKVGDISPGVRVFDETITCLLAQGRHTAYPYKAVPTPVQKTTFQQFLKHAAEVDARRTTRR